MKVVLFNGSPRSKGNTAILLKEVAEELEKESIETEILQLGGSGIRGCEGCRKCHLNKDRRCAHNEDIANEFIAKMDEADAIIFGTPTYFADVTSETKALIDRSGYVARANGMMFRRKIGAAVIAMRRTGAIHAFDTINHFFLIGEMIVPGSSYWNIGIGLHEGDVKEDSESMKTMQTLGRNMAWLMKQLEGAEGGAQPVAVTSKPAKTAGNGNGRRKRTR